MREILFKAQRADGNGWVEGYYLLNDSKHCIFEKGRSSLTSTGIYIGTEIIPETVCQFTGLTDKNGKKIWEHDLVRVPDNYDLYGFMSGEVREIIFQNGGFRFKPQNEFANGYWLEDDGEFEIIGNIHDKNDEV